MDAVKNTGIFDKHEQETLNCIDTIKGCTALGIWYAVIASQ
jgi:hypothetical protein